MSRPDTALYGHSMNVPSTLHPAWLATAAGVCLLLGLWLLRRGWRGRRVGDEPFCSKCGYSLQALPSHRCPECGAEVGGASGVVIGRRVRSRGPLGTGALLSISAVICLGGSGWEWARNFDWYTLKPSGYV